ncbi:hypothetical protein [Dawidia soli]|uniref:Uncharacterized protein n=1 Tax=Dawidia soli TaxID=2782352 RepID=A0AAP2D510_9BACT|nr:hypothetical protein [Dawidia soli]MBT1685441.1 hypothetical protein [Dawidia soli]
MNKFSDDSLGFEKFLIDEQIVSLLSQLAGGYVRLTVKAKKNHLHIQANQYQSRFNQIGKAKTNLYTLSYPEKVLEIRKYEDELKQILAEEKAA